MEKPQVHANTFQEEVAHARPCDGKCLPEMASYRVAQDSEYMSYAGSGGAENGCVVVCFDAPEKARAMQAWIGESGIAERPAAESAPNSGVLRVG